VAVRRWYRKINEFVGSSTRAVLRTLPYVKQLEAHERHIRKQNAEITTLQESLKTLSADVSRLSGKLHTSCTSVTALQSAVTENHTKIADVAKSIQGLKPQTVAVQHQTKKDTMQPTSTGAPTAEPTEAPIRKPGLPSADLLLAAKKKLKGEKQGSVSPAAAPKAKPAAAVSKPGTAFNADLLQKAAKQLRKVEQEEVKPATSAKAMPPTPMSPWTPAPTRKQTAAAHVQPAVKEVAPTKLVEAATKITPAIVASKLQELLHPRKAVETQNHAGNKRPRPAAANPPVQPPKGRTWAAVTSGVAPVPQVPIVPTPAAAIVEKAVVAEVPTPAVIPLPVNEMVAAQPVAPKAVQPKPIANAENVPPVSLLRAIEKAAGSAKSSPVTAKPKLMTGPINPAVLALVSPKLRKTELDRSPGGTPVRKGKLPAPNPKV
jgi:hypothetical protein